MQAIRLRGKYAVGDHAYAIVDDADYKALNQYKWKAKPNREGGNVYAIRTSMIDEKMCDIRMFLKSKFKLKQFFVEKIF